MHEKVASDKWKNANLSIRKKSKTLDLHDSDVAILEDYKNDEKR